ncbi:maleylacetoacetate isomerase [Erwinia rhapontici]|uniref:maleylacetoacetate isomerase n=1 Tax=Erwinia rhapontici TaxID=55212 RepID=UPI003D360E0E
MKLYSFHLSSASIRIRLSLEYKKIDYKLIEVDLSKGAHQTGGYHELNPQKLVPTLVDGDVTLTQSIAIIEYLEEKYPDRYPLIPESPEDRARVRSICQFIASEMQPLTNARVRLYMTSHHVTPQDIHAWCVHWIRSGLEILEAILVNESKKGRYCYGDKPTIADVFLASQLFLARRFISDFNHYPRIMYLDNIISQVPGFKKVLEQSYLGV